MFFPLLPCFLTVTPYLDAAPMRVRSPFSLAPAVFTSFAVSCCAAAFRFDVEQSFRCAFALATSNLLHRATATPGPDAGVSAAVPQPPVAVAAPSTVAAPSESRQGRPGTAQPLQLPRDALRPHSARIRGDRSGASGHSYRPLPPASSSTSPDSGGNTSSSSSSGGGAGAVPPPAPLPADAVVARRDRDMAYASPLKQYLAQHRDSLALTGSPRVGSRIHGSGGGGVAVPSTAGATSTAGVIGGGDGLHSLWPWDIVATAAAGSPRARVTSGLESHSYTPAAIKRRVRRSLIVK